MAESHKNEHGAASRGNVQEVRKQWAVHEDGALAYKIQNEEINEHYGLNRLHRKMVREDIPVAKFVQSEEELQQQEERMRQLEILKAQAEEDARMAKKISRQTRREARDNEVKSQDVNEPVDDEELARQLQEKERRKYQRHLEKKREKKLKKERQILEAAVARDLEGAGLAHGSENSNDQISASIESLNMQGVGNTRVTPSGLIEDNGDFSDFYKLPDEMDEVTRLEIQASQDAELATLLQEQEHKRTKAKVDQDALRKIEIQDEQLARIIQEQEQLKLKKARERHRARKEARRQISTESMPLGASANSLNQQHLPPSPDFNATPITNIAHPRYRSNSYTRACDSPPSPPRSPPQERLMSERINRGFAQNRVPLDQAKASSYDSRNQFYPHTHQAVGQTSRSSPSSPRTGYSGPNLTSERASKGQYRVPSDQTTATNNDSRSQYYSQSHQAMVHSSLSSPSSPKPGYGGPSRGMSTLESARRIAAGDPEGILAIQNSHKITESQRGKLVPDRTFSAHDVPNMDLVHGQVQHESGIGSCREGYDNHKSRQHPYTDVAVYSQPYKPHGAVMGSEHRISDKQEVYNRGDASGGGTKLPPHQKILNQQAARSGLHINMEDDPLEDPSPACSAGFNIAAAIDPTYQRRHPEVSFPQDAQLTSHIPFSRSLPQNDGDLQWDPNLRGSLRKTKVQAVGYQDSGQAATLGHGGTLVGEPSPSPWQPIPGQRRRDQGSRNKSRNDGKANCKQQ